MVKFIKFGIPSTGDLHKLETDSSLKLSEGAEPNNTLILDFCPPELSKFVGLGFFFVCLFGWLVCFGWTLSSLQHQALHCGHMGFLYLQHADFSCYRAWALELTGWAAVACQLSCPVGYLFPDQRSNPGSLHWKADSQPLNHQGSPNLCCFKPPSYLLQNH